MRYRCPHDGGACHHGCAERIGPTDCDRKRHNMRLTTPWDGFPVEGNQPVLCPIPDERRPLSGRAGTDRFEWIGEKGEWVTMFWSPPIVEDVHGPFCRCRECPSWDANGSPV